MKFRPCIDIHNGKVKQIVGSSLKDEGDSAQDNFVSAQNGDYYANLYKKAGYNGGHVIILNSKDSEYYSQDLEQARLALSAYPGGLQLGGGVTAENARDFITMGASHVIVTSYVFKDGQLQMDNLRRLADAVGRDHIVLDLSCRYRDGDYYIVTDRWQKFTNMKVNEETMSMLSEWCDEFLIHAVDVEGKAGGIDQRLASLLGSCCNGNGGNVALGRIPVTYAGGVRAYEDIEKIGKAGMGRLDVTVGSALALFGGSLEMEKIADICKEY